MAKPDELTLTERVITRRALGITTIEEHYTIREGATGDQIRAVITRIDAILRDIRTTPI